MAMLKGDRVGLATFASDVQTYLPPRPGRGQFFLMLEALQPINNPLPAAMQITLNSTGPCPMTNESKSPASP
jgi:uncharacterized protein (DUF58 family)